MNDTYKEIINKTDGMTLFEMSDYIENLRLAFLTNKESDSLDTTELGLPSEAWSHYCSALSYLDLADQALKLAYHAKLRG
jgi:hypothetical protein